MHIRSDAQNPSTLTLVGQLTSDTVNDIREALSEALAQHAALELDLSLVTHIDQRGAELLLRLQHEALRAQKPLTLRDFTPAVSEALDGMQLGRALATSNPRCWS